MTFDYRNGGEGMIKWTEDFVRVPIYPPGSDLPEWCPVGQLSSEKNPITGKSYDNIWKEQCEILRQALKMENGRFKYRLIVLCWMRGEGKSLLACMIQLWKFFCWPRQQIMLGANSKDQIKFVHYDIMRDIIIHSPHLLKAVGRRNIQEKEIRLLDKNKNIMSIIRSISTSSGIVSNITGYTFSEIFDMKKPKFFVQLDGSIRVMPNAFGVIDSTISEKTHVLYDLYRGFIEGTTTSVYFSYRHSKLGVQEDYWNPNMDKVQLDDYRAKFPFGEFERYFLNLWSAGALRMFTPEMIEEMGYFGIDKNWLNHSEIQEVIQVKNNHLDVLEDLRKKNLSEGAEEEAAKIVKLKSRFTLVDEVYSLNNNYDEIRCANLDDLNKLSDVFDTDWALLVGLDFADPMAIRSSARTMISAVLKGLPGSRKNPMAMVMENASLKFLYCIILTASIPTHSVNNIKDILEEINQEFDGIDALCSERFGAWDMVVWAEDKDIEFEPIFPTYDRQRDSFKEFYTLMNDGRLKCPDIPEVGYKKDDLFREEMEMFDHDPDAKWFGSPEKKQKGGIQDDSIYSVNWSIYGGRNLGPADFRVRKSMTNFGMIVNASGLVGSY